MNEIAMASLRISALVPFKIKSGKAESLSRLQLMQL